MNKLNIGSMNSDILVRKAKRLTCRFPGILSNVLETEKTFKIQMADRKNPMRGRILSVVPFGRFIDLNIAISKAPKKKPRR